MKFAKKMHKIYDNPCEDIQIYSARERAELKNQKNKQLKYIPYDHIKLFLETALEDNYNYYIFFKFLIETGMRKGEAMALQWKDVDLKNQTIKVEQTIDYEPEDSNDPFGDTKTFSSKRTFKITKDFALELRAHKVRQNDNVMRFKKNYKSELNLVLCREDGSPYPKSTLFNSFRRILKKAGLPNFPIHSLRHTHTVLMLESGALMKDMQMRLGHSSMQVTEDIYADTSEIIQDDSIKKFEKHTQNILNLGADSGQDK
ncbi:MAG: site-specific integrase [Sporolactobacillus sp.]